MGCLKSKPDGAKNALFAKRASLPTGDGTILHASGNMDISDSKIEEAFQKAASEIGKGAFATVFSIEWHGQKVALKRVQKRDDYELEQQMQAELLVPKALVHPNIVPLVGASTGVGRYFLMYELMDGGSLCDRLYLALARRQAGDMHGKAFAWLDRVRVLLDTTSGISCLHEAPT